MKYLYMVLLLLPLSSAIAANPEVRTIRKEVRQLMGGTTSQDEARMAAVANAKRQALEEAGTYLESISIVRNANLEHDEIIALSSGILQVIIVEEEPFLEQGNFGIRVVAEVMVDTTVLEERAEQLLSNRSLLASLRAVLNREQELLEHVRRLNDEISRLNAAGAPPEAIRELQEESQEATRGVQAAAWFLLAQELMSREAAEEEVYVIAIEYLTKAVNVDREFADAFYSRGFARFRVGRYGSAIEDFDHALKLNPNHILQEQILLQRGITYTFAGDLDNAIRDFSSVIERSPKHENAIYSRAIAFFRNRDFHNALLDFDQAILLNSMDETTFYWRGVTHRELGRTRRAMEDFSRAIVLNSDYDSAYLARGNLYSDLKLDELAIADYHSAISANSMNDSAYFSRGNLLSSLGSYEQSIPDFTRALELDPANDLAYNNRGWAYFNLGDDDKAIIDYTRALEIDSENPQTLLNRAVTLQRSGRITSALGDYDRLVSIGNPKYRTRAMLGVADCYRFLNRYVDAVEMYQAVLRESSTSDASSLPNVIDAHNGIGRTLIDMGRVEESIESFEKAAALDETRFIGLNNLAVAYLRAGRYPEALSTIEKALLLAEPHPTLFETRGEVLEASGDLSGACSSYRRSCELGGALSCSYVEEKC